MQNWYVPTYLPVMVSKYILLFNCFLQISACKAGNLQQVKACIKAGANPNYVDKLDPVSHFSVREFKLFGATLVWLDWTNVG